MNDADRPTCEICDRHEGDCLGRCGEATPDDPLGPIEKCPDCGRLVCPDCMHELDCCFADADEYSQRPDWAPPGWRVSRRDSTVTEYERL